MKKENGWFSCLLGYAKGSGKKLCFSTIFSVISITAGIVPYYCAYRLLTLYIAGELSVNTVLIWCGAISAAYLLKVGMFGFSTVLAHKAAYDILEGLRLRVVNRFMHAPLGDVNKHSIGELKSILVDKIEKIEPPLAHLIPEGCGHLVLPIVSFIALLCIDWRIALASLVTFPLLSLQEYCGDILNFKTYSKSYKNKKRIENDRENWVVFRDVHEPIIDRAVWEQVQQKRGKIRKRRTNDGERNMFSGLLVCADCGSNLHFHFNQGNPDIKYFNCSNYKGNRGTCTSTHYVRVDFLEQVVLGEIKRLTRFASHYEDDFVKAVMGSTQESVELDRRLKQKELATLQARDEELDGLFERIYEDNVSGKLSDDRFAKMSRRYEQEQKELAEKIKALRSEMDKLGSRAMTSDMFISTVRKYTRAKKLTPRMLNELIERIEVHQAEKIDGKWEQRLTIHYNCVGAIFIPDVFPLPAPQVSVNTRKGVVVNYAPCQIAI